MPVPTSITDLSTTAGSNYPQGTDAAGAGDDVIRALSQFIAELRDKLNGAAVTGTLKDPAFTGAPTGTVSSGTWTPALTNVGNAINMNPRYASYQRIGNIVQYSVLFEAQASATGGALTQIGISLPVSSNFAASDDASGLGAVSGGQDLGTAFADTANDRLTFSWSATLAGVQLRKLVGQYTVI